jgi:putative ABC transport system permease protein
MKIPPAIQKSLRSLGMHRLRTFLSTLGVVFGVVAVIAMLSIGEGAKQETLEQIEQLGTNSLIIRQQILSEDQQQQAFEKRSKGLTWEDAVALTTHIPLLRYCAPLKVLKASIKEINASISPEIIAVTKEYGAMKALQLIEGRFFGDLDQKQKRLVCVLGHEIAKNLGKQGHIGQSIRIETIQYEIIGVLQSTHWKASKNSALNTRNLNQTLFIPLGSEKSLPRTASPKGENLSEIILEVKDLQQIPLTLQLVHSILAKLHGGYGDYQVIIPQELMRQAKQTQQTFNLVLGSIAAISLLVGGIGIMNIMLATVSERTREIGVRRAVGANKQHIMMQFMLETLLLTLGGAILGVLIGIGSSVLIGYLAGWKTIITLWSIILSLGMSSIVGLCSGFYPAYRAATMDPIQALRHV